MEGVGGICLRVHIFSADTKVSVTCVKSRSEVAPISITVFVFLTPNPQQLWAP